MSLEQFLKPDDSIFTVRKAELGGSNSNPTSFVITVFHDGVTRHFLIKRTESVSLF